MGYVIVGGVCLVVGVCIGMFITALASINKNTESVGHKEDDIYMGTCNLNTTHAVPEEDKDADR